MRVPVATDAGRPKVNGVVPFPSAPRNVDAMFAG